MIGRFSGATRNFSAKRSLGTEFNLIQNKTHAGPADRHSTPPVKGPISKRIALTVGIATILQVGEGLRGSWGTELIGLGLTSDRCIAFRIH